MSHTSHMRHIITTLSALILLNTFQPKCVMYIIGKLHHFSFIIISYLLTGSTNTSAINTNIPVIRDNLMHWLEWFVSCPSDWVLYISWCRKCSTLRRTILWGRLAPSFTERVYIIKERALFYFYVDTTCYLHCAINKAFMFS